MGPFCLEHLMVKSADHTSLRNGQSRRRQACRKLNLLLRRPDTRLQDKRAARVGDWVTGAESFTQEEMKEKNQSNFEREIIEGALPPHDRRECGLQYRDVAV